MDINASGMSRGALSSGMAFDGCHAVPLEIVGLQEPCGAAPHYASRNDEASIRAGGSALPFQQGMIAELATRAIRRKTGFHFC
ncbi:hypothetical protein FKO01_04860 [Mesorhizobium sp. B2-3-3]|nr:hypothetical protein FKO01_04860 [Mesorhizobium sp. B2-3-3]